MNDTTPTPPVPEHFAGTVFPGGRGMEQHGVPMSGKPDLFDQVPDREDVEVYELPPEPDPIPVRIVREAGREMHRFRTMRAYAGDNVSQAAGRDPARSTVRLRNLSSTAGDRVWFSRQPHNTGAVNGYPLDPGAEITLNTEDTVHIVRDPASPTNPVPVAILTEYSVQEH